MDQNLLFSAGTKDDIKKKKEKKNNKAKLFGPFFSFHNFLF